MARIDLPEILSDIIDKVYSNYLRPSQKLKGANDINWAKEYESFYKNIPYIRPHVDRIYFTTRGNKKAGFVHVRPISDSSRLSETYLIPPRRMSKKSKTHFIKCLSKYNVYGSKVDCVPYIMPDSTLGMCIQASLWISLTILNNKFFSYELDKIPPTIPEIQKTAIGHYFSDGNGLLFKQATRIFRMYKYHADHITTLKQPDRNLTDDEIINTVYAYVESGFPVILGVDPSFLPWWKNKHHGYHSIVAIGHTMKDNKVDGLIVHDESTYPYQEITFDQLMKAWHVYIESEKKIMRVGGKIFREALVATPFNLNFSYDKAAREFSSWLRFCEKVGILNEKVKCVRPMAVPFPLIGISRNQKRPMKAIQMMITDIQKNKKHRMFLLEWGWRFSLYKTDDDRVKNKHFARVIISANRGIPMFYMETEESIYYRLDNSIYERDFNNPEKRKTVIKSAT